MTQDLRLSVSKCKTYKQCKKKFEFSYIQKLPQKDRDFHILGKFCHKVLEEFHKALLDGSSDSFNKLITSSFRMALVEYKDKMTELMKKECFDIISEYLKIMTDAKQNNCLPNIIGIEKNFMFPLDDKIILNGMIDRIQIDDDNVLHVADYKTTKNKKYLKNDWFQLLTYAYVILQENPEIEKIRASYILLRHDFEYMTTEFDVKQILEVKDMYVQYAHEMINETEYPATTSQLCNFCDFQSLCLEGSKMAKPYSNNASGYGEQDW